MLKQIFPLLLLLASSYATAQQPFGKPVLKEDSITITGVYKNYNWKEGDVFSAGFTDLITGKQQEFKTPIDKNGKFQLRFPVVMPVRLYLDWGRLFEMTAGIPGESFHIEADMNEYPDIQAIAQARDMKKLQEYRIRKRSTKFSGDNARLHNETMQFEWVLAMISNLDPQWKQLQEQLPYRDSAMAEFNRNMALLDKTDKNKKLLPASRQFIEAELRYDAAMDLSQFQYRLPQGTSFDESYLASIRQVATLNDSYGYLSSRFLHYLRDMTGYTQRGVHKVIAEDGQELVQGDVKKADSLFNIYLSSSFIKQLVATWEAYSTFEKNPEPMKPAAMKAFEAKVTDPQLRKGIYRENAKLEANAKDSVSLAGTRLITTAPALNSTAEVYDYIVKQHKGSVIYIDIWGTWCGPCREQMKYVPDMKKLLHGKDVVYVYLASSSPETSWKNMIRYYKLTGENVVHYNLPREAQELFEKEYLNRGWPTYILIDKEGKMVTKDAPRPQDAAGVLAAVNKLL